MSKATERHLSQDELEGGAGRDILTAALAEFGALHAEMLWRIQNRESLKLFTMTALGTLVSFAIQRKDADLLLAAAYLGIFGSAAYLHHCAAVTKIGRYIRDSIRPAVQGSSASTVFSWETYHRTDSGAVRLRALQYRARALANAVVFGGSIAVGLIAPAISLAQRLVAKRDLSVVAWELPLWAFALVSAVWLALSIKRWERVQISISTEDSANASPGHRMAGDT